MISWELILFDGMDTSDTMCYIVRVETMYAQAQFQSTYLKAYFDCFE